MEDLAEGRVEVAVAVVHGDVSTEFLKKLYCENKLSLPQISKLTNFSESSIRYRLKKENIKLRAVSEGTKLAMQREDVVNKISKTWFRRNHIPWNKGKENPFWKGDKNPMKNPEIRKKVSEKMKVSVPKLYKEHPEIIEKIKNETKKAMQRPEIKQKVQTTWFKKGYRISPRTEFKKWRIPWNKGRPWSEEFKKKQSIARKQLIENNPELLKKMLTFARPNKAENKLGCLLQKYFPNTFKFVGDGSFVVNGLNPDWIDCNDQKLIIELFGEHWHEKEEERKRIETFAKHGYSTLIIWWKEMRNEKNVTRKIANFLVNEGW